MKDKRKRERMKEYAFEKERDGTCIDIFSLPFPQSSRRQTMLYDTANHTDGPGGHSHTQPDRYDKYILLLDQLYHFNIATKSLFCV